MNELDLRSTNSRNIILFEDANLLPNFPMVRDMVKPWIIQENHFWIVTVDIPRDIFRSLVDRELVPILCSDTYEELRKTYYNQN